MKLTVLSENAVLYPGLEGEFGLSVYLEEGDTRLLFDAGERDACLRNAEKLGIDLRRVTAVAFSHNHRDHCGGFLCLAELLPPDVPIYAHSGFFIRKWWDHRCDPPQQETYSQTLELVGPPMEASWFFQQGLTGFRCLADDCIQIAPHVYLLGNFPAPGPEEAVHPSSVMEGPDGRLVLDTFPEEQVCVVDTPAGLVVLTGCAHNGIRNILSTVERRFRSGPSGFSAVPTWYPRTRNALPGRQTISGTAPSPVPVSVTAPAPWVWKSLPKQCPPICLPAQARYGRRPLSQGHPQAEKRVDRHTESLQTQE